jgi:hypothetical protein
VLPPFDLRPLLCGFAHLVAEFLLGPGRLAPRVIFILEQRERGFLIEVEAAIVAQRIVPGCADPGFGDAEARARRAARCAGSDPSTPTRIRTPPA